jgi:hypothetical protein
MSTPTLDAVDQQCAAAIASGNIEQLDKILAEARHGGAFRYHASQYWNAVADGGPGEIEYWWEILCFDERLADIDIHQPAVIFELLSARFERAIQPFQRCNLHSSLHEALERMCRFHTVEEMAPHFRIFQRRAQAVNLNHILESTNIFNDIEKHVQEAEQMDALVSGISQSMEQSHMTTRSGVEDGTSV